MVHAFKRAFSFQADSEGIKAEHIRHSHASISKGANRALYPEDLSVRAQILLLATLEALKTIGRAYITLKDTLSSCRIICEQEEVLRECVRALEREGYLIIYGQRIGAEYPLDKPI